MRNSDVFARRMYFCQSDDAMLQIGSSASVVSGTSTKTTGMSEHVFGMYGCRTCACALKCYFVCMYVHNAHSCLCMLLPDVLLLMG